MLNGDLDWFYLLLWIGFRHCLEQLLERLTDFPGCSGWLLCCTMNYFLEAKSHRQSGMYQGGQHIEIAENMKNMEKQHQIAPLKSPSVFRCDEFLQSESQLSASTHCVVTLLHTHTHKHTLSGLWEFHLLSLLRTEGGAAVQRASERPRDTDRNRKRESEVEKSQRQQVVLIKN